MIESSASQDPLVSVARAFIEARRQGEPVAPYPGTMPTSLEEAYVIQDHAIRMADHPIGGWKVGRIADDLVGDWGCNRLAGPILSNLIVDANGADRAEMPLLDGFAAIEAELIIRIATPIPADVDPRFITDYVEAVHFGLEVASSPFAQINGHGPAVTASDFGNNFGLLVGPGIEDWRSRDLLGAIVSLSIDGSVVGTGTAAAMLDGPFGALAFLAKLLARRGIPMPAGTLVSTGAITGVHPVSAGQLVTARFDDEFEVGCTTVRFAPPIPADQER